MNVIEFGDCRDTMRRWADQGVKAQMCVTSPPYFGLRDYGCEGQIGLEQTPEEYIAAMVDVFRCVRDVLADDATLWLNIGDSYAGGAGNNKGGLQKLSERWDGREYKSEDWKYPNGDPHCKKKSVVGHGGLKQKDLIGIPWMLAFALRADGWYLRQDIIWRKPNPMPESVRDRCTKAHEYIFLLSKSERYFYDADAIKEPCKQDLGVRDRTNGKYHNEGSGLSPHSGLEKSHTHANKRSVWSVPTKPFKGAHFATFPPALIEPCILAGSRPGDVVLDPFMGSGTTAGVAIQHGRQYIGCELNDDYGSLQQERIDAATPRQLDMLEAA
jgi:DNA modification methylase